MRRVRKMCVLACVISMLATLVACGSTEEPVSDSASVSSEVVSNIPEKDADVSAEIEENTEVAVESEETAEVSTESEEATEAPAETEEATEIPEETEVVTESSEEAEEEAEEEVEAEPEVIDVSKLVKKEIIYMDEDGSYYNENLYTYTEAGVLTKHVSTTYSDGEIYRQDTYEYTYDENGNLIKEYEKNDQYEDGNVYSRITITSYDAEGKKLKVDLKSLWNTSVTDYIYDEAGYLIEERETREGYEGEEVSRRYYTNDSHGNVIKTLDVDAYGYESESYSYKQYEYYEDGTLKSSKTYVTSTDALSGVIEYDKEGRKVVDEYWSDGVCWSREISEYNKNGERILVQKYRANSDSKMVLTYESIISEEDNTWTSIEYNDDGSVKYSGVRKWNKEFPEYDENGVLVSKKVYSDYDDDHYLYVYEYDEAGKLVKESCHSYYFSDNGTVTRWTEYYY